MPTMDNLKEKLRGEFDGRWVAAEEVEVLLVIG